jgi:serine protease Do
MRSLAFAASSSLALALFAAPAGAAEHWIEKPRPPQVQLPSLSPLIREVEPAVLFITTEAKVAAANDPRMDMFRRFGMRIEMPPQQGQGTGFIIHPDGYALTNHHVVEGATRIRVRVGGGAEEVNAVVIGDDPRTDVALIKLEGNRKWPAIPLGNSDTLNVGDFVLAIGNPFGLSQSVSTGIISAKSRRDIAPSGRQGLYDFLQTDASINPGNSGGPLINMAGEVIGINSAVNAAGQGLGFAIPINLVKQLVPDLKQKGRVDRAWIGVQIRRVTPELAKGLGLERSRGALVASVVESGPGWKAGLKPGDVITKFDGKLIEDSSDLPLLASVAGVGRAVPVELLRDGALRSAKVTLGELPKDDQEEERRVGSRDSVDKAEEAGKIGVRVDTLDDELRARLELPSKVKGAVVLGVGNGSAAEQAGLEPGDVVTEVNGAKITDVSSFVKALDKAPSGKLVKMLVIKRGSTTFLALTKP